MKRLVLFALVMAGAAQEADAIKGAYGNGRGAYGNGRGAYGNGRGAFGNGRGAFGNGRGAMSNGLGMVMSPDLAQCLAGAALTTENLNYRKCSFISRDYDLAGNPVDTEMFLTVAEVMYGFDGATFDASGNLTQAGVLGTDVMYIAKAAAKQDLRVWNPSALAPTWSQMQAAIAAGTASTKYVDAPSSQEMQVCQQWATGPISELCANATTNAIVLATNQTRAQINVTFTGAGHTEQWNRVHGGAHAFPVYRGAGVLPDLDFSLTAPCTGANVGGNTHCGFGIDYVYKCAPDQDVRVSAVQRRNASTGALEQGASWIPAGASSTAGPDLELVVCAGENACTRGSSRHLATLRDEVGFQPEGVVRCPGDAFEASNAASKGRITVYWRTYNENDMQASSVGSSPEVKIGVTAVNSAYASQVRFLQEADYQYREETSVAWNSGMFNRLGLLPTGKAKAPVILKSGNGTVPFGGAIAGKNLYGNIRVGVDRNWVSSYHPFRACSNDNTQCIGPELNTSENGVTLSYWENRPNAAGSDVYGTAWFMSDVRPIVQATNNESRLPGQGNPLLNHFARYRSYNDAGSSYVHKESVMTARLPSPESAYARNFNAPCTSYIYGCATNGWTGPLY